MVDGPAALGTVVGQDTIDRLTLYANGLKLWQSAHNLVGPKTLAQIWSRHFADSWQLAQLGPLNTRWVDIGSGAGFPGLVVALAMMEHQAEAGVVELVETNPRKIAFLREMIRKLGAPARVHATAIEDAHAVRSAPVGVVTARAFAPLRDLCRHGHPFVDKGAIALFPKGQDVVEELTEAAKYWIIDYQSFPSQTAENSVILCIRQLRPKG